MDRIPNTCAHQMLTEIPALVSVDVAGRVPNAKLRVVWGWQLLNSMNFYHSSLLPPTAVADLFGERDAVAVGLVS